MEDVQHEYLNWPPHSFKHRIKIKLAGVSFCSCYLLLLTKENSCKEMLFLCLQFQQHHHWLGLSKTEDEVRSLFQICFVFLKGI